MFATGSAREHSDAVILEIGRDTVSLLFRSGGTVTREAQGSTDDAGIRQLARILTARGGLPRALLFRLPPERVLHKELSLPLAAQYDLKEVLGFEIDRETPFARDEVYWSYAVREADGPRKRIGIELAVVPRCFIDPVDAAARRAGLDPAGIEVDMGEGATALIPLGAQRRANWALARGPLTPLAAAACILIVIAAAIPFIRQQSALVTADAMIASLTEPAREASALRQPADRLTRIIASLKEERDRNGSALAALAAATIALPDETYLTTLNLRAGRLTMNGLSPSAARLVGLLARRAEFREPVFDSPVVESGTNGLEEFGISVNVAAEGAP
jgi:general secretion pathway protein L